MVMWLLTRTANVCPWLICCKTLCCAANTQLSNPRNRHLESDIARFGSSLNRYCAWGASKIVLQQYRAEAAQIHGRSHGGFRGQTGRVVLTPSFVESDPDRSSRTAV
jgi:hypothetical protein